VSIPRSKTLWMIVAVGFAVRLVLAFAFRGTPAVTLEEIAALNVRHWNWDAVYDSGVLSWIYTPGFLPWLAGASWLSDVSGLSFHGLAKLGMSLADVGLALAIYAYLRWRGAAERACLIGAALVMLGPSFIAVSGYHGQIDSVAILPAVLALMLWERGSSNRSVKSGLLIGLGAAVKPPAGLLLAGLLGSARSWREATKLAAAAIAVPALVLAPLWISGVNLHHVTSYRGVAGWGGLTLLVDPAMGWRWLTVPHAFPAPNGAIRALKDASTWITAATLTAYLAFILRYRPAPIDAAVLLWLAIYVFSPNFFLNYLIWGLPFFIMAGYLVEVAVLQALLIVPMVGYYLALWPSRSALTGVLYVPSLIILWAFFAVATFVLVRRIVRRRDAYESGMQPPLVSPSPIPG
jgi:hypothetical protein